MSEHDSATTRLQALRDTGLLDSAPEPAYDRITAIAARVLHAPIAVVSLIDRDRQFFKSAVGLPEPFASARESPLSYSYCKYPVETGEPLVVDDSLEHPLVRDNRATTEMGIRSYAGVPLFAPGGEGIGTLCVVGTEPRYWTDDEIDLLWGLAAGVQSEIALRHELARLSAAERALKEAEERYRSLVDALPVIVYLAEPVAPYGTIYVSPAITSLGYSLEEWAAVPDRWIRLLHPDDRDRVLAETQAALAERRPLDYEYRIRTREGDVRWIHDRGHFVLDPEGRPLYWQGVMMDITTHKASETLLHENRVELRQLIDVVPHLLFVKDEEGRYIMANRAFAALHGMAPKEVVGKTDLELGIDASEVAVYRAEDQEVMRSGEAKAVTAHPRRDPDGAQRSYDVLKVPFRRAGTDRPAVLGLVRDATEEREQAQQLQRAQRLASVGTLVGGVAHELNNPLSAIMGFSQLMLMDPRSDEDRQALETIHRESDRMARIVADLRRLARESQEPEAPRVPVDLNEVIRHVLRLRGYSLSTHNIEVVEDFQADLSPVMADPGRLEQVVLNLVTNAEQAMTTSSGRGILHLRTRSGDRSVSLYVDDTGPGIAPEHQERIFDPFWSTKAPGEGTGLGLSLVHGIVDDLGGHITVESPPTKGACFTVVLPRAGHQAVTQRSPAQTTPATQSPPASLRVLIVDDEAAIRSTLVRYLKRRGYEVSEAEEGSAALQLLAEAEAAGAPYDAIVSDLRMPGLDGSQLLARLREEGGGMEHRLLFLTGDAASPDAERLLEDAAVPVVLKPFDFARVEEIIQRVATGRASRDASLREHGERLQTQAAAVLKSFLARLRTDPGIQDTTHLGDADLEDHTCMLIAGVAQSLLIPELAIVDRDPLLEDGQTAMRTVSELHGAQRSRIAWTDESLAREYQILQEEIMSAIRGDSPDSRGGKAVRLVTDLLDETHQAALTTLRRERARRESTTGP